MSEVENRVEGANQGIPGLEAPDQGLQNNILYPKTRLDDSYKINSEYWKRVQKEWEDGDLTTTEEEALLGRS